MNLFSLSRNIIDLNCKTSSFSIFLFDKIKSICFSSYPEKKLNIKVNPFLSSIEEILSLSFDLPSIIKSLTSFILNII